MSIAEGKSEFNRRLKLALNKSPAYRALQKNYREKLNYKYIHILDISENALKRNADTPDKLDRFNSSYKLFLSTIESTSIGIIKYNNISELRNANPDRITKGVIYVREPAILICPSFGSARSFITYKISKVIPRDEFFGITDRARTLEELAEEGYDVSPINPDDPSEGWKVQSEGKKIKIRYFDAEGYELVDRGSAERRSRELSNLDIGHLYTKGEKTRQAPLSFKLEQLLKIPAVSPNIKQLVDNALTDLSNLEANVGFSYINNLPKGLTKGGYLTLTLEFYTLNGLKSLQETTIYNQVREEIVNEVRKNLVSIPGSNTMSQDAAEIIRQGLVAAIKGTKSVTNLQSHGLISGNIKDKPKVAKTSSSSVTITTGSKQKKSTKKVSNNLPPTTSLTSLQLLINTHLQNVISANMGDGSSKKVLNYRTGRFAGSAKVETMSQSRQGMITAFYSYMKNPYQTFEPGFKQGTPKTRDPKLLISQSIREIAATRVSNQLRAQAL